MVNLRPAVLAVASVLTAGMPAAAATIPADNSIHFDILRDGDPVGTYVMTFAPDGGALTVTTDFKLLVKAAFITLYKYERTTREEWQDHRLVGFTSATNDNGTRHSVTASASGDVLKVQADGQGFDLPADVIPSSFWNDAVLTRGTVLDAEKGRSVPVKVEKLGRETMTLGGQSVEADKYLLTGMSRDYTLWYLPSGEFVRFHFASSGSDIEFVADPSK